MHVLRTNKQLTEKNSVVLFLCLTPYWLKKIDMLLLQLNGYCSVGQQTCLHLFSGSNPARIILFFLCFKQATTKVSFCCHSGFQWIQKCEIWISIENAYFLNYLLDYINGCIFKFLKIRIFSSGYKSVLKFLTLIKTWYDGETRKFAHFLLNYLVKRLYRDVTYIGTSFGSRYVLKCKCI